MNLELHVSALVMSSVILLLPTLTFGTVTAAPDHKEDGPKYHNVLEEHQYSPHGEEDTIGAGAIYRPNCGQNPSPTLLRE